MRRHLVLVLITLLIQLVFPGIVVFADENHGADYSVHPILPDNQREGRSFFDLRVEPGTKQTLQIQINNFSDQEQTYFINVNTAQTNGNIVIDYGQNELPEESIVQQPICTLVDYPKEAVIPGNKAGVVTLEVQAPDTSFDGILLGGIQVKKDFSAEKEESNQPFFSEYAYVVGLMMSANDKEVVPDLKLNEVRSEVITNNAGVVAVLENPQPINIKGVTVEATVHSKGQEEPIMTRKIENGGIAPESVFAMPIYHGEAGNTKPLESGDYQLLVEAQDETGQKWLLTKDFTITKEQANSVNHEVFTVENNTNSLLYIIIGALAAVPLVGGFYVYRRGKKFRRR